MTGPWGLGRKPFDREEPEEPTHHWEVCLLDWERELLLALLEGDKRPTMKEKRYLAAKFHDAQKRQGPPLPVCQLDWRQAEREAGQRGESLADWLWDRPVPPAA